MDRWTCCNPSCAKDFERYRSQVRNPEKVYCSRRCKGIHSQLEGFDRGKNNANFRHGQYFYESFCSCGKIKDHRASECGICSRRSAAKSGESLRDIEAIRTAIQNSWTLKEAAELLELSRQTVTRVTFELGIDISHFTPGRSRPTTPDKVFVLRKTRSSIARKWLLRNEPESYACASCGQGPSWLEKPLSLQLHHINGNSCDDRRENLSWLCPNCHSQTENYTGRKQRGLAKPRREVAHV